MKRGKQVSPLAVIATVVLAALSGCATTDTGGDRVDTAWAAYPTDSPLPQAEPAAVDNQGIYTVSWAEGARSETIAELRTRADLVVVAQATGGRSTLAIEQEPGSEIEVSAQTVEYVVVRPAGKGGNAVKQGDLIAVVEPLPGVTSLPHSGYVLLYLREFEYWIGDRPDGTSIVYSPVGGPQGVWIDEAGQGKRFTKTDKESPGFPDSVGAAEGTS